MEHPANRKSGSAPVADEQASECFVGFSQPLRMHSQAYPWILWVPPEVRVPFWFSLVTYMIKNLPAMQETWVGKIPWRREWQPTLVFLPGEFHGQRSLAACSTWIHKESDMTE